MKLCLINAPYSKVYGKFNVGRNTSYPLGLGYISSVVKQHGHSVLFLDPEAENITLSQSIARINSFKPHLVGISSVTSNFNVASLWAKAIKDATGSLVMIGGVHVTALPEKSLTDCPFVDFVVQGEAEYVVAKLCDYIEAGNEDYSGIESLCYRKGATIVLNKRGELIKDLDSLPFPDRESVDLRWYRLQPHFTNGRPHATVISSRGCPSSCTFCGNIVTGRKFRARSPQYFVDELETLVKKYAIRHFHIVDDNFAVDKKRLVEICGQIIKRDLKISWFIFGRADHLNDEDMLSLMKRAGCVHILFGVESGSQEILDTIKKNITIEEIKRACLLCRKVGILYTNSFIIGNPGETAETVMKTIRLAIDLKSVIVGFNIMIPFPGSPVFNQYYQDTARSIIHWDHWCSVGDDLPFEYSHTKLRSAELMKLTAYAYSTYYFRLPQLMRMLMLSCKRNLVFYYIKGALGMLRACGNWRAKGRA